MSIATSRARALRALPSTFADLASRRAPWFGVLGLLAPALMLGLTGWMLTRIEAEADTLARREYQAQQALLASHAATRLGGTLDRARRELAFVARDPSSASTFARRLGVPSALWRTSSTGEPLLLVGDRADLSLRGAHQLTVVHPLGPDDTLVAVLDAAALHEALFSELARDHDGYVWVLDDWGAIVSSPDPSGVGSRPFDVLPADVERALRPVLDAMIADERGVAAYPWHHEHGVEERLAAYAPVPGHETLSVAHSVSSASVSARTHALHASGRRLLLTLLAIFSALAVGFTLIARRDERRRLARALELGQYTLEERIGEGGMGVVYRARHAFLRRPTAVKLISPTKVGEAAIERFAAEAQALASLRHPSTVTLYDYGRNTDGVFYYAMELLDGFDLDQVLALEGALPLERVVHWLDQVLGALGEAHALGLIHRDVKPANLMTCRQGGELDVAKLLDFGLVTERGVRSKNAESAEKHRIFGTPLYLAPEAITRPLAIDHRVDLYALGASAYELTTGKAPFPFEDVSLVLQHHLVEPVSAPSTRNPTLPPAFDAWVLRCLEKDPARRFASADEARAALRALDVAPWTREHAAAWWRLHDPKRSRDPAIACAETLEPSELLAAAPS